MRRCLQVEVDKTCQHHQRADKGVDEELEGYLYPALSSPAGTKEVNRYKCQFPEEVKQEAIGSKEDAVDTCNAHQQKTVERMGTFHFLIHLHEHYCQHNNAGKHR